jgi:hypothetical protein
MRRGGEAGFDRCVQVRPLLRWRRRMLVHEQGAAEGGGTPGTPPYAAGVPTAAGAEASAERSGAGPGAAGGKRRRRSARGCPGQSRGLACCTALERCGGEGCRDRADLGKWRHHQEGARGGTAERGTSAQQTTESAPCREGGRRKEDGSAVWGAVRQAPAHPRRLRERCRWRPSVGGMYHLRNHLVQSAKGGRLNDSGRETHGVRLRRPFGNAVDVWRPPPPRWDAWREGRPRPRRHRRRA